MTINIDRYFNEYRYIQHHKRWDILDSKSQQHNDAGTLFFGCSGDARDQQILAHMHKCSECMFTGRV